MTILNPDNGKHWHEDIMLDSIIRNLENTKLTPRELKESILNPTLAGELSMPPSSGDNWISYVGISYSVIGAANAKNTHNIEGVMLNKLGISIIRGTESDIKNFKELTFDTRLIIKGKLSADSWHYHCVKIPNNELYSGGINNYRRGRIRIYNNDSLKKDLLNYKYPDAIAINHAIKDYYREFIAGADSVFDDESITKPVLKAEH